MPGVHSGKSSTQPLNTGSPKAGIRTLAQVAALPASFLTGGTVSGRRGMNQDDDHRGREALARRATANVGNGDHVEREITPTDGSVRGLRSTRMCVLCAMSAVDRLLRGNPTRNRSRTAR